MEFLIPGVQHAEKADLGAEVPGIASHFETIDGSPVDDPQVVGGGGHSSMR